MRQFFRGGRELPLGQGYVCRIKQNRLLRREAPRKDETGRNDEMWSSDDRVGRNVSSLIIIFCVLFSVPDLLGTSALAQSQHRDKAILVSPVSGQEAKGLIQTVLRGVVSSLQDGKPIEGASVSVDKKHTRTDKEGRFTISVDKPTGVLLIRHIGYKEQRVAYENTSTTLNIALQANEKQIEEVEVVSTGYQKIPKERATGSFEFIDSALFNRKVSTDILSRLEDVVPGLSTMKMNKGKYAGEYVYMNIRGMSTLGPDAWPLIVVDGVPYESKLADNGLGMFNNINPNDIESISVLKDAAALSIWGARSANGVIVVTTKKGKFESKTNVSFNTNITRSEKPDLYYYPQMNTSDYIDLQKFLFDKGRYPNSRFTQWNSNPQPILWMMYQNKRGQMTDSELEIKLDELRGIDMRDDFEKYIYREAVRQQHHVQIQSGGSNLNSIFSAGYDKNLNDLVTSSYKRLNLKSNTQFKPIKGLLLDLGIVYTQSRAEDSFLPVGYNLLGKGVSNWPYMRLADDAGNPLELDISTRNRTFMDTVAGGRLLSMDYFPLKELYSSKKKQDLMETLINFSGSYDFDFGLRLNGLFSYQRTVNPIELWLGMETFFMRNAINSYASWTDEKVTWNFPLGDHRMIEHWDSYNKQWRFNMEYHNTWQNKHQISAFAGTETRELQRNMTYTDFKGVDRETGTMGIVPYGVEIPQFNGKGIINTITSNNRNEHFVNRFVSAFANASYTYDTKYILSGSFRRDASNLFGVKSNERGQPFWSMGGAWLLSKEPWLQWSGADLLKLRATYGYNGNINPNATAYPILSIQSYPDMTTLENYAVIGNPPNPKLRWERTGVFNLGLDMALFGNRLSGAIEYYRKRPKDLIGFAPVDPTVGYSVLTVNTANLDTKGWDVSVQGRLIQTDKWDWTTNIVFSYARTKVTKAHVENDMASRFTGGAYGIRQTPIEGMDIYSQLTYKWAGLDPDTGEPRAYLNGEISKDYISLISGKVSDLENHGSLMPLYFGSFRQGIRYKSLQLSANISYQLGHVFQRRSFFAGHFFESQFGHSDYALRWQKPGDEQVTDVPALTYPINTAASQVYEFSSALTENAGQIKLRDLQLTYSLPHGRDWKIRNARLYVYVNNVGVIWRANKKGIDPEYGEYFPAPLSTSVGFSFNL